VRRGEYSDYAPNSSEALFFNKGEEGRSGRIDANSVKAYQGKRSFCFDQVFQNWLETERMK